MVTKLVTRWILGVVAVVLLGIALVACGTSQAAENNGMEDVNEAAAQAAPAKYERASDLAQTETQSQQTDTPQADQTKDPYGLELAEGAYLAEWVHLGFGVYKPGVDVDFDGDFRYNIGARAASLIMQVAGGCTENPANWCLTENEINFLPQKLRVPDPTIRRLPDILGTHIGPYGPWKAQIRSIEIRYLEGAPITYINEASSTEATTGRAGATHVEITVKYTAPRTSNPETLYMVARQILTYGGFAVIFMEKQTSAGTEVLRGR